MDALSKIAVIRQDAIVIMDKILQDGRAAIETATQHRTDVMAEYETRKQLEKDYVKNMVKEASEIANQKIGALNLRQEEAKKRGGPDYVSVKEQLDREYQHITNDQTSTRKWFDAQYGARRASLEQWMQSTVNKIDSDVSEIRLKLEADIYNIRRQYKRRDVLSLLYEKKLNEYIEPADIDTVLRGKMAAFGDVFCTDTDNDDITACVREYLVVKRVECPLEDALLSRHMFETLKKVADVRLKHGSKQKVVFSVIGADEIRVDFIAFPDCKWTSTVHDNIPETVLFSPLRAPSRGVPPFDPDLALVNTITNYVLNETCKTFRDDHVKCGYVLTSFPQSWVQPKKRKYTSQLDRLCKEAHEYISTVNKLKKW